MDSFYKFTNGLGTLMIGVAAVIALWNANEIGSAIGSLSKSMDNAQKLIEQNKRLNEGIKNATSVLCRMIAASMLDNAPKEARLTPKTL